jgi:hypothetical protein
MVDALVASIFALRPSRVLPDFRHTALFDGTLLSSNGQQVHTDRCSNIVHVVGVRLGLDPRRCSGISARKTMATAIVCHPQTTAFDTHRFLGHMHADPRTTHVHYADPRAANNDNSAILRRQQVSCVVMFHACCWLGISDSVRWGIASPAIECCMWCEAVIVCAMCIACICGW